MSQNTPKLRATAAIQKGDLTALQTICKELKLLQDKKFGTELFEQAVEQNCFQIADWLLDQGVNLDGCDSTGYTPLLHAVYSGEIEAVKYLLRRGASVRSVSPAGNSVLHVSIDSEVETAIARSDEKKRHVPAADSMTRLLVKYGADASITDKNGQTALDWAIERRHEAAANFLKTNAA